MLCYLVKCLSYTCTYWEEFAAVESLVILCHTDLLSSPLKGRNTVEIQVSIHVCISFSFLFWPALTHLCMVVFACSYTCMYTVALCYFPLTCLPVIVYRC